MCVYSISKHDERAIIWAHLSLNMHNNRRQTIPRQQQQQPQQTSRRRKIEVKLLRVSFFPLLLSLARAFALVLAIFYFKILEWTRLHVWQFRVCLFYFGKQRNGEMGSWLCAILAWYNCKVIKCDPVLWFFFTAEEHHFSTGSKAFFSSSLEDNQ